MAFRIIRGAAVGIILGLAIGVLLSGSMYMFNYMKSGADWDKEEPKMEVAIETDDGASVPTMSISKTQKPNYDLDKMHQILREEGITAMARELAKYSYVEEGTSEETLETKEDTEDILGDELVRFHVKANSNSDVDVALKYKVRDRVIEYLGDEMQSCETTDEALEYLTNNLEAIKEVSKNTLVEEGYGYEVEVYLTNDYFPMRQYGDMVLPAGYYQALRIDIGLANGENFWCLLYPTLCVPIEAGGVVTKEGQEEIEEALTQEQYDKLFVKRQVPKEDIEIRFKLWDMIFK